MTNTQTTSFDALERTDYWCMFDGTDEDVDEKRRYSCCVDQDGNACFLWMYSWQHDQYEVGGGRAVDAEDYALRLPWQTLKRALRFAIDGHVGDSFSFPNNGKLVREADGKIVYVGECAVRHVFDIAVMQALADWLV